MLSSTFSLENKNGFLWSQSKDYNNETLQEATQYLETLDAGYEPKELFEVIQATIESRVAEIPLEIILLTGAIFFTSKKVRYLQPPLHYFDEQVEKSQGNIQMFCLGFGIPPAHGMIERISRAGSGLFRFVQSGERLDASVVHMLRRALGPHIWNAVLNCRYDEDDDFKSIDKVTEKPEVLRSEHERSNTSSSSVPGSNNKNADTLEIFHQQIIQAPQRMPDPFAEIRSTVCLLVSPRITQKNLTSIILRHLPSDRLPILEIPVQVLTEKGPTIHQFAARKAIQEIEQSRGWMHSQTTSETQPLAEKEIVRLGERFQIMNNLCSFIAVRSSDEEILNEKLFSTNLSDANLSAIITPRTPPPKK